MYNKIGIGMGCGIDYGFMQDAQSPLAGFYTNFWQMADLTDSIGSLTLTNSATPVTFSAGKIGNAGNFVRASSENLTRNSVTLAGPSFTISLWSNTSTAGTAMYLFSWNAVTAPCIGVLYGLVANKLSFFTDAGATKHADWGTTTTDGAWHLVVAYHDSSTGNNVIIVDNGTPVSVAATADLSSASKTLTIGSRSDAGSFFNGSIDAVGIADGKIPTAAQITAMWNAGAGVEPPF